ncbi:MAG: hypothetical protein J6T17_07530, partial [Clostridia bacterium]|nr:hypothetical protein [Clostridia bacterium]
MKQFLSTPKQAHYGGDHAVVRPFAKDQTVPAILAVVLVSLLLAVILIFGASRPATPAKVAEAPKAKNTAAEPVTDKNGEVVLPHNTKDYQVDSTIIVQGTRAMEIFTAFHGALNRYGTDINNFAAQVPGKTVYVLLAPTSIEFYGPDDYKTKSQSFETAIEYAYEPMTASNIKTVNCRNAIAKHVDEYIYLRTDHHWSGRGAYYAYTEFCKVAGLTAPKLSSYESGSVEGFVGSLYAQTQEDILKQNPDTVTY